MELERKRERARGDIIGRGRNGSRPGLVEVFPAKKKGLVEALYRWASYCGLHQLFTVVGF